MSPEICDCAKRLPSGRVYSGEEICLRCNKVFLVTPAAKTLHKTYHRRNLGRLAFTRAIVPDMQQLRVDLHAAIGLRHPSHYKGVGGSSAFDPDEAIRYLSRGYAEGDERLQLMKRLQGLMPDLPERSIEAVINLISFLRG